MNLSSDPDPQPGTGLQSYPTASPNPQPQEEVILCPLSDNETEGQSGHPHTVVEMAENVDGLISASPRNPRPSISGSLAPWAFLICHTPSLLMGARRRQPAPGEGR